jgi:hypothetical protein
MSFTACIRGCTIKGKHLSTCDEASPEQQQVRALFGDRLPTCKGCLPHRAAEGTLLCSRDLSRLRENLDKVPDLCAHLRSATDPLRAHVYDSEQSSKSRAVEAAAPMNLAAVDASTEVAEIVAGWAIHFGSDETAISLIDGFPSWVDAELAYEAIGIPAAYLSDNLERCAKDTAILLVWDVVCGHPPRTSPDGWTVQKALDVFPMFDRASWASAPCPNTGCSMRTIRVTPPSREGELTRYICTACGWAPAPSEHETWDAYFGLVSA